jgi:sugar phosphate isomerase/epimerase
MGRYKLSCSLYSVRLFPPLEPVLEGLAEIGYDAVEPFLPNYGDDPKGFRKKLDAAGLSVCGFHMPLTGLTEEPDRFIDIAKTIGASQMIPPWIPPEERDTKPDGWKKLGEALGAGAEKANAAGLKVAWHNHDFEFMKLSDGSRPIDHIFASAGPNVGLEIDIAWVVRGGADPAAELIRYADRIMALQPKDTAPLGTKKDDGWAPTGDGIIDWKALWPLFLKTKADHIAVEHDNPSDWRVFAQRSYDYLKSLGA